MSQAVRLPGTSVSRQAEDRTLSDEVHGSGVLVQICKHGSQRLARVQFLRGRWILGVHGHHEVGVCGKERHLAFRITTIGAVDAARALGETEIQKAESDLGKAELEMQKVELLLSDPSLQFCSANP
jgi:hypothetical protein